MKKYYFPLLTIACFFLAYFHQIFAWFTFIFLFISIYLYVVKPLPEYLENKKKISNEKKAIKLEEKKKIREEKEKERIIKNMAKFYSSEEGQKYLDDEIREYEESIKKGEE